MKWIKGEPKALVLFLFLTFALSTVAWGAECQKGTVSIANFNIQVFGETKAGKEEVMDVLAKTISEFDIVAIQEIRTKSGESDR